MSKISYATQRNSRYSNNSSNLVTIDQRFKDTVNSLPVQAKRNFNARLKKSLQSFTKNHPNVTDINDQNQFRLCQSLSAPILDIVIDTTIQRELNLQWIITIIENFRPHQAQPIQVYPIPGGKYAAWDGQHTSIALSIIANSALQQKLKEVKVPVNIYSIQSRGEIRSNFINNNTTVGKNAGKKPLDIIDIFQQMIYGVEVDKVKDPEWIHAHTKWKILAKAGMFLTGSKFNDTDQVGAISRLNEIQDSPIDVVDRFAVYGNYVVSVQQRPINSKEIPVIMEFFNLCKQQDIIYDDATVRDLAQHCIDLFDANFDAKGPFWDQAHQANINAWNKQNRGLEKSYWSEQPRNNKNTSQGLAFFWHQLRKSWVPAKPPGFKFPKQPFSVYQPDPKDLF